jgi:hypothetical protein
MPGLVLWLEPTREGRLPVSSLYLASDGFVASTYVLGAPEPSRRMVAYERILRALAKRIETVPLEKLSVKHIDSSIKIACLAHLADASLPSPSHPARVVNLTSFNEILEDQELLYGELPTKDRLKLVAQAVYGGEHMLKDSGAAWNFLLSEWNSIELPTDEPLAERISPDGELYRINLRPSKELGIQPEVIYEAALHSATEISRDMQNRIERVLPQALSIGIEPDTVPVFPSRHSESYKSRVKPSYRLIRSQELNDLVAQCV